MDSEKASKEKRIKKPKNMKIQYKKEAPPDGGWGWIIVAAAFCIGVISQGLVYSFGSLYIGLLETFNGTKSETAWVGSIMIGTLLLCGPVTSVYVNKFGPRVVVLTGCVIGSFGFFLSVFATDIRYLYFSFGFLLGIGNSFVHLSTNVCVGRYFVKKKATAIGITACGVGVGTFVFNPLQRYLLDTYGLRGTFLIDSGLMLQCAVFGSFFRPLRSIESHTREELLKRSCNGNNELTISDSNCGTRLMEESNQLYKTDNEEKKSDEKRKIETVNCCLREQVDRTKRANFNCCYSLSCDVQGLFAFYLLSNRHFLFFLLSVFLLGTAYQVPFTFVPDMAREDGYSRNQATWLISVIGIGSTVGRLVIGPLSDLSCINRIVLYKLTMVVCGVVTGFSPFYFNFSLLIGYAAVFGLFVGGFVALQPVVLSDLFGPKILSDSFGLVMGMNGITAMVASPIAGMLFDMIGRYDIPFAIAGTNMALSGLVLFCIPNRSMSNEKEVTISVEEKHSTRGSSC